jgi:hypothetical protein
MSALDAIAGDLALALDPALVFRSLGMTPDPWQAQLLRSNAARIMLLCHRQGGKSAVMGVLGACTALYEPQSLVLLLSPSLRQSTELFKKCLDAYRAAGKPVPADAELKLTLELSNGSRIISLPGKEETIRGYSGARLILIDEAARVPDELYYSVRPMLAVSGGRLVALSTPFGKRGWFHTEWVGSGLWERYEVPATECPRITAEFLAEERRAMGVWYDQEYLCQFLEPEGSLFRYEDIQSMFSDDIEPLFGPPLGLPEPQEVSTLW